MILIFVLEISGQEKLKPLDISGPTGLAAGNNFVLFVSSTNFGMDLIVMCGASSMGLWVVIALKRQLNLVIFDCYLTRCSMHCNFDLGHIGFQILLNLKRTHVDDLDLVLRAFLSQELFSFGYLYTEALCKKDLNPSAFVKNYICSARHMNLATPGYCLHDCSKHLMC